MFRNSLLTLVLLIFVTACSTPPPAKPRRPSYELTIEASSRDRLRSKSFYIDIESQKLSLADQECASLFAMSLSSVGFQQAMVPESAEQRIEITYTRESPVTGTPVFGTLTPYHHEARIRAVGLNHVDWEMTISADSTEPGKTELCPFFAAGGSDFYARSTNGKQKITLRRDDPKVQRLLNADKKQGLLE